MNPYIKYAIHHSCMKYNQAVYWYERRRYQKIVLFWLGLSSLFMWFLTYQYDHDPRVIKLQQENENQRQLINKQQDYIKNVVAPVKKIMYRNRSHSQEIYEAIMKTKYPELTARIIEIESKFYQYAVSWANCYGLMQVSWEHGLEDPFDIKTNIRFGAAYFEEQLERFGTVEKAVWAYNAGPASVDKYLPIETAAYIRKFKREEI